MMTSQQLEKVEQLHADFRKLLEGLDRMVPFVEFVREYAMNKLLGDTVTALLNLVEDSSNFILEYLSGSSAPGM